MNKAWPIIGAIVSALALIPTEVFSWWRAIVEPPIGDPFTHFIVGFVHFRNSNISDDICFNLLENTAFWFAYFAVVVGVVLLLLSVNKSSKLFALGGAIACLAAPILFAIGLVTTPEFTETYSNVFFGQETLTIWWFLNEEVTWFVNVGMFLPIGGTVCGFLAQYEGDKKRR